MVGRGAVCTATVPPDTEPVAAWTSGDGRDRSSSARAMDCKPLRMMRSRKRNAARTAAGGVRRGVFVLCVVAWVIVICSVVAC